ncbi:hypothetical protein [Streptomyces sp. NBC_00878]|uniref:hypothetical protein n=1 Tax=Streptomyces sp. NBC_00878 TaxID=2975854 RepID=UPI00225725A6|nr:hypothetical protein [Streptomyces sp. NBC_00878]MCX4906853.1 hypothetical protein [Streptomyces sp. NBC_00878]
MSRADLRNLANAFAGQIEKTLNRTITNNAKIKAVVPDGSDGSLIPVGQGLTKRSLVATLIPLHLRNETPTAWLDLIFQMCMDDQGEYLMVRSSYIAIAADPVGEAQLCHFDYERDKGDGYPEAHLQIHGPTPPALTKICKAARRDDDTLAKLHFPVGGRRFRPCLEDVIEFLITERLARGHPDWQKVIEEGREGFQAVQLRAAMRKRPDVVEAYLGKYGEKLGWQRVPPPRSGSLPVQPRRG